MCMYGKKTSAECPIPFFKQFLYNSIILPPRLPDFYTKLLDLTGLTTMVYVVAQI